MPYKQNEKVHMEDRDQERESGKESEEVEGRREERWEEEKRQ